MAVISDDEGKRLSKPKLAKGVFEENGDVDQSVDAYPTVSVEGRSLEIQTTPNFSEATGGNYAEVIVNTSDTPPTTALELNATLEEYKTSMVSGDVEVSQVQEELYGVSIKEFQIEARRIAARRQFSKELIHGDGSGERTKGLHTLISDVGQSVDASQADLTLNMMIEAHELVTANNGQCDYILMNSTQLEKYRQLVGANAKFKKVKHLDNEVITFQNIPVLRNDFISEFTDDSPSYNEIYFVVMGWGKGLCIIYPKNQKGSIIKVEKIPKSSAFHEVYRVTLTAGIAAFSHGALVCITNLPPVY